MRAIVSPIGQSATFVELFFDLVFVFGITPACRTPAPRPYLGWGREGSSPELCVKVRGSSSMLLLGCLGDLLRFEKREIQVATFAPDRSSP